MVIYTSRMPFDADMPITHELWRAAVYVRKSDKTEGVSKSRDQQLEHCKRVAEKLGFILDEKNIYCEEEGNKGQWYWDDGTGRFPKPYRTELGRMMRDIESGESGISVVLIWRSDRLYRDNGVCDAIIQVFRRKDIRFFCGVGELDVNSSSGLYQAATEAANNRRWRDQISEDIKRDHQFKAEMGMFTRDPSCLGYRSKGLGTQEVDPIFEELDFVMRIFSLYAMGGDTALGTQPGPMAKNAIAKYLMKHGVLWPKGIKGHKRKHATLIHESQIDTVLKNCMYAGRWRHAGQEFECDRLLVPVRDAEGNVIPGKKVTAIPISLYEAVQQKLARNDRSGKRSLTAEHLLSGIAVCARCGRPLHVHYTAYKTSKCKAPRKPRANFHCPHTGEPRPCPRRSSVRIQEPVLDAWVLEELAPLLVAEIQEMRSSSALDTDRQTLAGLQRQLSEASDRETKKLAFLIDTMDPTQVVAVAKQLRAEREQFERRIVEVKTRLENSDRLYPDLTLTGLQTMPKSALKEALSRALSWIAVGKTGITVQTRWGSYIGAEFRSRDPNRPDEEPLVIYIASPTPLACLLSLSILPVPEEFIRGRRDSLGKKGDRLTDEDILPGWCFPKDDIYVSEADVSHMAELLKGEKERAA